MTVVLVVLPIATLVVGFAIGAWHSAQTLPRRLARLDRAQLARLGRMTSRARGGWLPPGDDERPSVAPAEHRVVPTEPEDWQARRPPPGTMLPSDPPGRWSRGS